MRKERTIGAGSKTECPNPREVIKGENVVDVSIRFCPQDLFAHSAFNQNPPPTVRTTILEHSKQPRLVVGTLLQWKRGGIDGECVCAVEPRTSILKCRGTSFFCRIKAPDLMRLSPPVYVNLQIHVRLRSIRLGSRSSSMDNASTSLAPAASPASRSCNCRTNITVAKVPRATVGSPRSRRQSVSRLTNNLDAMSAVEMPRLRRARDRSRPNLRSAWATGSGMEVTLGILIMSCISDVKSS